MLFIKKLCEYCEKFTMNVINVSRSLSDEKRQTISHDSEIVPNGKKTKKKIKELDNYLFQICIRELYGTKRKYNHENLQVHHAIPINSNKDLKLDENNLVTLCSMHHSMCDKGQIPYKEVKKIIIEQTQKETIPSLS